MRTISAILVLCALLCAPAGAIAAKAKAGSPKPKATVKFTVPIIFETGTPDIDGLITDRAGLARVRIVWGQGSVSNWKWQDQPAERITRMSPRDAIYEEEVYYDKASTYTVRVIVTNRKRKTTIRTLKLRVEPYSPELEASICEQYDCGEYDKNPQVE